jgi:hypothetical protein
MLTKVVVRATETGKVVEGCWEDCADTVADDWAAARPQRARRGNKILIRGGRKRSVVLE